jgi:hypothetical protein
MKHSANCILIIFIFFFVSSCNSDRTILEGEWQEIESDYDIGFGGEVYKFTFKNNSFTLKYVYYSDMLSSDPCSTIGYFMHYSGSFEVRNDTLLLAGKFVKRTYDSAGVEIKVSDCNKSGSEYNRNFIFRLSNDTLKLFPRVKRYLDADELKDSIVLRNNTIYLKRK